jgi:membrane protein DedA with SNARE-associated domain
MSENATSKLYGNGRIFGPSMQTKLSLYTLDASIDETNLKNPGRFNQRSGPFTVFLGRLQFNSDFDE